MKLSLTLLLVPGCLLGTARAQTAPARLPAAQAPTTAPATSKAIGRAFEEKSKPTDRLVPVCPVKK